MERLTRKLKKGGYSANRHSEAQLTERLDQLKGVHKQWLQDVSDMMTGMKQSEAAGQEGALTLMMLQAATPRSCASAAGSRARAPSRAAATTPPRRSASSRICTSSACPSLRTWRKDSRSAARTASRTICYDELMVTKLGISQLIKQFDIATGYAEPDPEPYQYQPKTDKPVE